MKTDTKVTTGAPQAPPSPATVARDLAIQLAAPFPVEMERAINKGGVEIIYIPISEVIARLNMVLGVDGWSMKVVSVGRDETDVDEIISHVALSARFGDVIVEKHGVGGSSVKRIKNSGKTLDLGNDFKGAVSDGLKKAAQQLGVGLYLARTADALDIEDAMNNYIPPAPAVAVPHDISEKWEQFSGLTATLTPEGKTELGEYWKTYSDGKPKPKKETVTIDALDKLIGEATRLSLGGKWVQASE